MYLSSPNEARTFDELRKYQTRTHQFKWGHENVHFGKMHFRNPNINIRIFFDNLHKFRSIPGVFSPNFVLFTMVLKNSAKNGPN